jgi:hypothetical protein
MAHRQGVTDVARGGGRRAMPIIEYERCLQESPGNSQERKEVLMWWELALARKAQERLRDERMEH